MEIVLFSASWCSPCKQLKQYALDNGINFDKVLDVDSEDGKSEAARMNVRGVPTIIVSRKGEESNRIIGFDASKMHELKGEK